MPPPTKIRGLTRGYFIETLLRKMSCPYIKKRSIGSGYEKPSVSEQSKEMEERMAKMLAERSGQDTKYFPHAHEAQTQVESKPVKQTNVQNDKTPLKTF